MKIAMENIECVDCENTATKTLTNVWIGMSFLPETWVCDECYNKIISGRTIGVESILYIGEISPDELKEFLEKQALLHKQPIDWKNIVIIDKEPNEVRNKTRNINKTNYR